MLRYVRLVSPQEFVVSPRTSIPLELALLAYTRRIAREIGDPRPSGSNRRKPPTYGEASVRTEDLVPKFRSGSVLRAYVSATARNVRLCSVVSWKLPSVTPGTRTTSTPTPRSAIRTAISRFGDPKESPNATNCFHRGPLSSSIPPRLSEPSGGEAYSICERSQVLRNSPGQTRGGSISGSPSPLRAAFSTASAWAVATSAREVTSIPWCRGPCGAIRRTARRSRVKVPWGFPRR